MFSWLHTPAFFVTDEERAARAFKITSAKPESVLSPFDRFDAQLKALQDSLQKQLDSDNKFIKRTNTFIAQAMKTLQTPAADASAATGAPALDI